MAMTPDLIAARLFPSRTPTGIDIRAIAIDTIAQLTRDDLLNLARDLHHAAITYDGDLNIIKWPTP